MKRRKRFILLAFVVAVIGGVAIFALRPTGRAFDAAVWRDHSKPLRAGGPKQKMADQLVERKTLIGLHRDEVISMLGSPTEDGEGTDRGSILEYYLGPERGLFSIDGEVLSIELDDEGRVVRCRVRHT